jgi:hypothetical protein
MIRATETNPQFLPWDPSPASETSGGVSFSWLRKDNGFSNMVYNYNNGLIFYPSFDTPPDKNDDIKILCTFPHDGATNDRPQQGCGATPSFPTTSKPCNEQGINAAQLWITKFNAAQNKYHDQCGWNVREGQSDSANRFYQSILARGLMQPANWAVQNELRLATWLKGSGATLPIQSFFYLAGSTGLNNARNDQNRYYQNYKQFVPIIRVTLPASKGGAASFVYNEGDQGILPKLITFENVALATGLTQLVLPEAKLEAIPEAGSETVDHHFSIRESSTILDGHYLELTEDFKEVQVTPSVPTHSVSYDIAMYNPEYNGEHGAYVRALYSDGQGFAYYHPVSVNHYTFTAPQGKIITKITFHPENSYTIGVDNIKFE